MTTHSLQLATEPFNAIINGKKTIESRLYDDKRKAIQIGDILVFTNRENAKQTAEGRVVGLLRYDTFHELFSKNDPNKFGGPSVAWLEDQINEFYTVDDQRKFGVLGIEFELVS